ncbi:MAG TPA: malate dehydrogenase, partial [Acidimicrobiales bacterium]|nr:malate dehydrogenase [Acidimicrobiales bacterium]
SAANAVIDTVVSLRTPTPAGDCVAVAVPSRGEYGVPEGLQFGFPVRSDGATWEVAEGFVHDDFAKQRLQATTEELVGEREAVSSLLT